MADTILYLAHTTEDGGLPKAAWEALAAAVEVAEGIGAGLVVGLIGADVQAAADSIAGCGATRFLGVAGAEFGASRYATDAAAVAAIVKAASADVVIAPQTVRFARAVPGAAQRVGGRTETHITGFDTSDGLKVQRWYYRQRMVARLSRAARPWFLLVDSGVFAPKEGISGSATIEPVEIAAPESRTNVVGIEAPAVDTQTIRPDAETLFVAGAGWTKKQRDGQAHVDRAGELILDFVGKAKASLGSSKSLNDQASEGQAVLSFFSHLNQVGQTGSTPRHQKGLATCCHGEEPHVVGWRFVNERRVVNIDPNCGWAQGKTDVLYVADAFEVMEKVNALL